MKPFLFILLSSFVSSLAFSQATDFIVVKKHNNRTVKSYFTGLPIALQTESYTWVNGWITDIRHDSIFVKQYDIRQVPTIWGTLMIDTAGSYNVGVYYKEIRRIEFDEKGSRFGFITNGTIFMIGGVTYAVLNVVNGRYLHESITDSKNMTTLGIALGVAAGGFILNRIQHHKNKRWKYEIEYIRMTDVKKQLRGF
jgi:hypothetical protein